MLRASRSFGHYSRGAMLLLTMFIVAFIGIMLVGLGRVWHTEAQRDKEVELLMIGEAYASAITRYHAVSPSQYPENLEQLLLDTRQPRTVRHLRRLYRDPLTGNNEWGIVKDVGGRVIGVYSKATGVPFKQHGFVGGRTNFNGARNYADWAFVATPVGTNAQPFPVPPSLDFR